METKFISLAISTGNNLTQAIHEAFYCHYLAIKNSNIFYLPPPAQELSNKDQFCQQLHNA